jgi:hypothetical protein
LTWDQEDADRIRATRRRFTRDDLENMDFSAYLASSASESENETGMNPTSIREKYKALLLANNRSDEETKEDMEITFTSALTDSNSLIDEKGSSGKLEGFGVPDNRLLSDKQNDSKKARRKHGQNGLSIPIGDQAPHRSKHSKFSGSHSATTVSEDPESRSMAKSIGKKTKQKREIGSELIDKEDSLDAKQHADLQLLMLDERIPFSHVDTQTATMNRHDRSWYTKEATSISQKPASDTFEVNVADPRFSALYDSSEYAIDPTNPQ